MTTSTDNEELQDTEENSEGETPDTEGVKIPKVVSKPSRFGPAGFQTGSKFGK